MAFLISTLIRLYPRPWRTRYEREMRTLLATGPPSLRMLADLLAGAIDARFNPQLMPAIAGSKGLAMTNVSFCNPSGLSSHDQRRAAAWLVGGSIALTAFGLLLQLQIGKNALSEGLVYAAFPASLMLSSECTYLKRYSGAARTFISLGGALLMILMMCAAVAIGNRL